MARVTSTFQALSKEVIHLIDVFHKGELLEASRILEELQQKEKEKLSLTVKWQVLAEKERTLRNQGCEGSTEGGCMEDSEQDRKQLRKR